MRWQIIILIIVIIITSVFLERLSMWNMLNCAEQVQIQKYKHMHIRHPKQQVSKQSCRDTPERQAGIYRCCYSQVGVLQALINKIHYQSMSFPSPVPFIPTVDKKCNMIEQCLWTDNFLSCQFSHYLQLLKSGVLYTFTSQSHYFSVAFGMGIFISDSMTYATDKFTSNSMTLGMGNLTSNSTIFAIENFISDSDYLTSDSISFAFPSTSFANEIFPSNSMTFCKQNFTSSTRTFPVFHHL